MAERLGALLRRARQARGLTLRELSQRTGLSVSAISQIETGLRVDPGFSILARLAQPLGLSLDVLAQDCGFVESPFDDALQALSSREKLFIIQDLDAGKRALVFFSGLLAPSADAPKVKQKKVRRRRKKNS